MSTTKPNLMYCVEVPPGYYRIMSGYHMQSEREALCIARDHEARTGQRVVAVHRPRVFNEGMPFHLYARS